MPDKKVYSNKNRIEKSNNKMQLAIVAGLVILILIVAVIALSGKGKNPASSAIMADSYVDSASFDESINEEYEDEYITKMKEYSDVIIPQMNLKDDKYTEETLFVGDSNTEALSNFYYVPIQYVCGYTGMGIQSVTSSKCIYFVGYEEPVTIPAAVGMLKPRRVIINFGTNNAGGMEVEDFIKTYEKAINAIKKAYPYCDIIVESIFPVGKVRNYPKIKQTDIDEMNLALAQMCRDDGYKFLNTAECLKGDDGFIKTDYISSDGIHLSKNGYTVVLEYVDSHKFITADTRPARGTIPRRRTAPVIASSSDEMSSSIASSSSIESSSAISSSIAQSSSVELSSSVAQNVSSNAEESSEEQIPSPSPVHEHDFSYRAATCTENRKCGCGVEKEGSALGHNYTSADETCPRCGRTNPNYVAPRPDPDPVPTENTETPQE